MERRVVRRSLSALTGVLALGLGPLLTGCGSASAPSPPTGVDDLTVPTPSVDPSDFVERITNPWLPYAPGATWTYAVTDAAHTAAPGTQTVVVRRDPVRVDGVDATAVDVTDPAGTVTTDYYAQDRSGNVWWLGRAGAWQAGEDGAEAGLVMPAKARLGDGWREAYAAGVAEDTATVVDRDGTAATPAGQFGGLLVLHTRSRLEPDGDRELYFAQGAGLVLEVATDGPAYDAGLVSTGQAQHL